MSSAHLRKVFCNNLACEQSGSGCERCMEVEKIPLILHHFTRNPRNRSLTAALHHPPVFVSCILNYKKILRSYDQRDLSVDCSAIFIEGWGTILFHD